MTLDLTVFGDICIDYFYEVNKLPGKDESAEITRIHRYYGGMGANTAITAKKLGLKTAMVSVISSDNDASEYVKYIHKHRIDLFIEGRISEYTTHSMFFKKNDGDFFSFFHRGIAEKMNDIKVGVDLIKNSKAVFMPRTYLNLQRRVASKCRAKKKFLVYNPGYGVFKFNRIPEEFYRILKSVNVLVMNYHELVHLRELGFELNFRYGPEVFLVTKGSRGCSIYGHGIYEDVPAFKTAVVDPAGAGDAFNAGFIASRLKGYSIADSVKIANCTASFVIEKWGCQTNLPSWEQVMERFEEI
ncbi:MAG: hypothetical protein A7315_04195 [Candidatus Altiarchaeales archaeon WOR_SM1_79]|nr:MAG: hypothetical protein A7315_04195 [Candidatus Altiarchaeales archaeon WOR_SM1_79]